jgi:general secretion pathway protein A
VHKEALDTMVYSISSGEGFVMITGTPGVGKTLLVRTLLRELGEKVSLALVLNPTISPRELLSVILDDLGISTMEESQNISKEMLLRRFRDYLLEKSTKGIKTIIIIDEAQNLPKGTLEELRMLSNLETDKEKLLQIILVGQLELEERLQYDEMKQLAQRITIRYRIRHLSPEETGAYVRHRLEVAGGDASSVKFMPRVMAKIHALSDGIPRRINLICERALMAAYVKGDKSVSRKHLVRAIKSIEGHEEKISMIPGWLLPAIGGGLFVLAAGWAVFQYNPGVAPTTKDVKQAPVAQVEKNVHETPAPVPVTKVEKTEVASQSEASGPEPPVSSPEPISKSNIQVNARVLKESTQAPQLHTADRTPQTVDLEPPAPKPEQVVSISEEAPSAPGTSNPVTQKTTSTPEVSSPEPSVSAPYVSRLTTDILGSKYPGLLPINEFYLAVDRDKKIASLWQGGASGSVLKHEFELDWRIMEGLYILGNDKVKGAFIFNPILFQWGGYNLLNASALWSQVDGHVLDALLPVIVYSSENLDKEIFTSDIPTIRDSIDSWAQSWRDRDISTLMSFYSRSFTSYSIDKDEPATYTLPQLREIRGRILGTSSYISLSTSTPICLVDPRNPDLAIAFFRQEYQSNIYKDQGTKVLYLRREGNYPDHPWKIVAKFFLPKD